MENEIRQKIKEMIKKCDEAFGVENNRPACEADFLNLEQVTKANEKTLAELTKKYGEDLVDKIHTEELDASKKYRTTRSFEKFGYDETLSKIEFAFDVGMLDEREYHNQLNVLEELKAKQQS